MRIILELKKTRFLVQLNLTEEETEGVEPREEDARDDLADTGFTEA